MRSNKLLVIVGPTGSGKSALAMRLARLYGGEIVCADSRTVYKGLDVGTAKPTRADRNEIPHYLLDVVEPNQPFTVADFKKLAEKAIDEIKRRGKLPMLVGGSGLYVDSVLFNYGFSAPDEPRDPDNPRHLAKDVPKSQGGLRQDAVVIGLELSRQTLRERIAARVDDMVSIGLIEEVKKLLANYPNSKALDSTGYKAFIQYLDGDISLDEAKALFVKNDLALAKKQMTWFRRNKFIQWFTDESSAIEEIDKLLVRN